MGIADKVNQMVASIQTGAKNASHSIMALLLKLVTVFMVGMTLAMIGQEIMNYGTVSFMFVMILTGTALFKVILEWSFGATLIFDLILVLVALLLRTYILIAP